MSNHFKVLGFLANSFPQVAFNVVSSGAVAETRIDIEDKEHCHKLLTVGTELCFEMRNGYGLADSIEALPYEDESVFAGRIVTLISQYS